MKEVSKGNFIAELKGLPEYEWVFTYIDNSGFIYGTNNAAVHRKITISISITIYIGFLIASIRLKKAI
ncbi:MAG: hypothetical protein ACM3TR_08145 [Caulobacteraceae bacterium]